MAQNQGSDIFPLVQKKREEEETAAGSSEQSRDEAFTETTGDKLTDNPQEEVVKTGQRGTSEKPKEEMGAATQEAYKPKEAKEAKVTGKAKEGTPENKRSRRDRVFNRDDTPVARLGKAISKSWDKLFGTQKQKDVDEEGRHDMKE